MSVIAQSLDTPFERLALLPTTMNWLGVWISGTLYFRNSVVRSPADQKIYILTTVTSLVSTVDPSTDPLWEVMISSTASGILSLTGTGYINVDNTDPLNPIVNNTGVVSLLAQNGLQIGLQVPEDFNNPLILNTGVLTVGAGLGISVVGNTITNTGVTSITSTAGSGIQIAGDPTAPTVINNGVISVVAGANITISPTGAAPSLFLNAPIITPFLNQNDLPDITLIAYDDFASVPIPNGSNPNSILFKYINGTPPDDTGAFVFDFSGWTMLVGPSGQFGLPSTLGHNTEFSFFDSTTGNQYTRPAMVARSLTNTQAPFVININPLYVPISALKAAGLTRITNFVIRNLYTPSINPIVNYTIQILSTAATYATYYPYNLL